MRGCLAAHRRRLRPEALLSWPAQPHCVHSLLCPLPPPPQLANYVLWPLAHLVNFKYVPSDWRILFNNVVALGWVSGAPPC